MLQKLNFGCLGLNFVGLDSISVDMKEQKLTVIGDMDPVAVVKKLRKNFYAELVSVGPAKEPEKPKSLADFVNTMQAYNYSYGYNPPYYYVEQSPNGCVIC